MYGNALWVAVGAVITEDAAGRILLDLKEIVKRYDT